MKLQKSSNALTLNLQGALGSSRLDLQHRGSLRKKISGGRNWNTTEPDRAVAAQSQGWPEPLQEPNTPEESSYEVVSAPCAIQCYHILFLEDLESPRCLANEAELKDVTCMIAFPGRYSKA